MNDPLWQYLSTRYRPATARHYSRSIGHYLAGVGEEQARKAGYVDLLAYLERLRQKHPHPSTLKTTWQAIKSYYDYLYRSGLRTDHPAQDIIIKDKASGDIQFQDLFTPEELSLLEEEIRGRKERYPLLALRNQVVISLLIHQAPAPQEIPRIRTADLDLEAAQLRLSGTAKLNERRLKLVPEQILLFYRYLHEARPKLLRDPKEEALLVSKLGSPLAGELAHELVKSGQYRFPSRSLNPKTIRMSVIRNWLKAGKDLRVVQVMAGHRKVSTTEKYRQSAEETLKHLIDQFHPLNPDPE